MLLLRGTSAGQDDACSTLQLAGAGS
jgi:hypothetical protein